MSGAHGKTAAVDRLLAQVGGGRVISTRWRHSAWARRCTLSRIA